MKKLCAVLVLLVLLVAAVAFAEGDVALNLTQVHDYEVADSLCYVGDTLYMLGTYGVYAYQGEELSTAIDLSDTYLYRYNQERPEERPSGKRRSASFLQTVRSFMGCSRIADKSFNLRRESWNHIHSFQKIFCMFRAMISIEKSREQP